MKSRPKWTWGDRIVVGIATAVPAISILLMLMAFANGHDSWISRGAYKNKLGEWCCGDYDCKSYPKISSTARGWIVEHSENEDKISGWKFEKEELIPYDAPETIDHVAPPDGGVTICRRPDGSRRCVFGLKPGI